MELWKTHTVIYPKNFNMSIQHRVDESYNHIEMIDSVEVKIRVIQYSKRKETRELLENYLKKYENYTFTVENPVELLPPQTPVLQTTNIT